MEPEEVTTLYVSQAQQLEEQGKYKEAERLVEFRKYRSEQCEEFC